MAMSIPLLLSLLNRYTKACRARQALNKYALKPR